MSGSKIQITPGELLAQSLEMRSLQSEIESVFGNVSSTLLGINDSWSPILANNFVGKINSAKNATKTIAALLAQGADIAENSAKTFESVDAAIAKAIFGGAVNASSGSAKSTATAKVKASNNEKSIGDHIVDFGKMIGKGVKKSAKKVKKVASDLYEGAKETVVDAYNFYKDGVTDIIDAAKENYNEHGWLYDAAQYGKATLKAAKGVGKIAAAVVEVGATGGAALPVAILQIASAGNDIYNAAMDATYVYTDQYEEVGKHNGLRDYLAENGKELGELIGNEKLGETIGTSLYYGVDVVSTLASIEIGFDKLKQVTNTDLSGLVSEAKEILTTDINLKELMTTDLSELALQLKLAGYQYKETANMLSNLGIVGEIAKDTYSGAKTVVKAIFEESPATDVIDSISSISGYIGSGLKHITKSAQYIENLFQGGKQVLF